jgi:hypothetical protein
MNDLVERERRRGRKESVAVDGDGAASLRPRRSACHARLDRSDGTLGDPWTDDSPTCSVSSCGAVTPRHSNVWPT